MDGWPGLLWPPARLPSYHLVVTGTAADTLLFTQWYTGSWGWEGVSLRAGGQQPLGELLTVYTIVYSSVIKSSSALLCCLSLFSDSISSSLNP